MDAVNQSVWARMTLATKSALWHGVMGLLAALALLGLYLGLIGLAQGFNHAFDQFAIDRWFVLAIVTGFGTQVGLFSYLRSLHAHAGASGVAASTGASTTAMVACCAHHLADLLPILGISGAAIFLNDYQREFLWLGIIMNTGGVTYLLYQVRKQRRALCRVSVAVQGAR